MFKWKPTCNPINPTESTIWYCITVKKTHLENQCSKLYVIVFQARIQGHFVTVEILQRKGIFYIQWGNFIEHFEWKQNYFNDLFNSYMILCSGIIRRQYMLMFLFYPVVGPYTLLHYEEDEVYMEHRIQTIHQVKVCQISITHIK